MIHSLRPAILLAACTLFVFTGCERHPLADNPSQNPTPQAPIPTGMSSQGPQAGPLSTQAPRIGSLSGSVPVPELRPLEEMPRGWMPEASVRLQSTPKQISPAQTDRPSTGLFWENLHTGDRVIWAMEGPIYTGEYVLFHVPLPWRIAGAGDLNGDGQDDIVWQNPGTGDRYLWLMNGTVFIQSLFIGNIPPSWEIAGVGDMNGDGMADLVWQNTASGDRYLWLMNGAQVTQSAAMGNVPSVWEIAAVGDFDNDSRGDLVWQNTASGDRYLWLMNGAQLIQAAALPQVDPSWDIAGVGNLLGGGWNDILWQHRPTGQRAIWDLEGTTWTGSAAFLPQVPAEWNLVGAFGALPSITSTGTIAYTREDELRLIEPDGSGDRLVWAAPPVNPAYEVKAPAWRPDGSEIAFVSDHEEAVSLYQKDLYAVRPDGSGLRKLTNGPTYDRLASFPKGTVTVTVSNVNFNGGPFLVYVVGAREPQWVTLGPGGSSQVTFTDVADLGDNVSQPVVAIHWSTRWSDTAAVADVKPGQTTNAGWLSIGLYDGLERTGAYYPLWRADGSKVGFVYAAWAFGNPACLLQELPANPPPAATGDTLLDPRVFGPVCGVARAPTPELADQLLVVDPISDVSSGKTHVYRVAERSPTRGAPVVTFDRFVTVMAFDWLPDGSGFLVARQDDLLDEDVNLYEFSFATRSLRKITDFTGEFVRNFSISPDGRSIVFERVSGGSIRELDKLPSDLWVMNRDGSGPRLLVKNARDAAWNPQRR